MISTTNPDEPPLPKRRNYEIIDRLQTENAAIFNPRPVYDGRKIMFSTRQIPDTPVGLFYIRFHRLLTSYSSQFVSPVEPARKSSPSSSGVRAW